jgi:hypothetical protein
VLGVLAALLCTCHTIKGPGGGTPTCQFDPIDISAWVPSGLAGADCNLSIVRGDATISYLFPSVPIDGPDAGSAITKPDSGPGPCSVWVGPAPTSCSRRLSGAYPDDVDDIFLYFEGPAAARFVEALHVSATDDTVTLLVDCTGAPTVTEYAGFCVLDL